MLAGAAATALLLVGGATAWAGALLPERGGSPNADRIASLYTVVLVLAALVFAGVAVTLVFALVRYRERRSPVAAQIRGNTRLEIGWTVAAAGLIVFLAVFSLTKLDAIEHPDPAVGEPRRRRGRRRATAVAARCTSMSSAGSTSGCTRIPNGAFSYEEMVAPVGVTVELDIVSVDVAHSWWIPKLGGKFDAIPGYVNHTWFRLKRAGVYRGQCAELCGRNHADMVARVRGVSPAAYARWVARQKRLIDAANADGRARAPSGRRLAVRDGDATRRRPAPTCGRRRRHAQLVAHRVEPRPAAGWAGWVSTTDHKRIGVLYLATAFAFMMLGGVEALLMRTQLAEPGNTLLTAAALQPGAHDARHDDGVPRRSCRCGRASRTTSCRCRSARATWRSRG